MWFLPRAYRFVVDLWYCTRWKSYCAVWFHCCLPFGCFRFRLLVSTFCETQQQAMFIMFFFMMIFILWVAYLLPLDSMPEWAKIISEIESGNLPYQRHADGNA